MKKYSIDKNAKKILDFWFHKNNKTKWWIKDQLFDQEIRREFEEIYYQAVNGKFDSFVDIPEEALALIILFDQLPRNMFRNTAKAFATDDEALAICEHALRYKYDYKLQLKDQRHFLYMPLMHSESLVHQIVSVKRFATISEEAFNFAKKHQQIILEFGRFPQRNHALGRESIQKEIEFISNPKNLF